MESILVTDETSQPERLPLKAVAPKNMPFMSVTPETSQPERSPSNFSASRNMFCMEDTCERSGASVALYTMLDAPWNAPSIVVQVMFPHCSMDRSLSAFAVVFWPRLMPSSPPAMETL